MVAASQPANDGTILGGSLVAAQAATVEGFYTGLLKDGSTITFNKLEVSGVWLRLIGGLTVYGGQFQAAAVHMNVIEVRAEDLRMITGQVK